MKEEAKAKEKVEEKDSKEDASHAVKRRIPSQNAKAGKGTEKYVTYKKHDAVNEIGFTGEHSGDEEQHEHTIVPFSDTSTS